MNGNSEDKTHFSGIYFTITRFLIEQIEKLNSDFFLSVSDIVEQKKKSLSTVVGHLNRSCPCRVRVGKDITISDSTQMPVFPILL